MKISDSELKILEVLWLDSPLTVGQIIERIQKNNDWHANTIKTLLSRVNKKNAVIRNKDGKRFFYSANITQKSIINEESEGFLSKFFDGRIAPLVAHFSQSKKLSKKDIEEIELILSKLKKEND